MYSLTCVILLGIYLTIVGAQVGTFRPPGGGCTEEGCNALTVDCSLNAGEVFRRLGRVKFDVRMKAVKDYSSCPCCRKLTDGNNQGDAEANAPCDDQSGAPSHKKSPQQPRRGPPLGPPDGTAPSPLDELPGGRPPRPIQELIRVTDGEFPDGNDTFPMRPPQSPGFSLPQPVLRCSPSERCKHGLVECKRADEKEFPECFQEYMNECCGWMNAPRRPDFPMDDLLDELEEFRFRGNSTGGFRFRNNGTDQLD